MIRAAGFIMPVLFLSLLQNLDSRDLHGGNPIRDLEKKHAVRFFYNPEWIEKADSSITGLPLDRAVTILSRDNGLRAFYIDNYIILVPGSGTDYQVGRDENVLVIGDPAFFGQSREGRFSGQITDGRTGEPLPGALIFSENNGTGISTDQNGNFSMNLPVGEHRITISYVGYENTSRRINLVGSGSHDFHVFEEVTEIDEVVIMAQRAEGNISRTRMSAITLDARSINELPGQLGERDIIRSMTLLPGIQSVGEFGTGFHVRGGSADQNLILLEDVPLFNSSHLFGLTSVINPDMVSGLTLIKGGIPARYGERVSSVMDIRLKPEPVEKTSLQGGIGLLNSRVHLLTPVLTDRIQLSVGARSSYSDWLLGKMDDQDLMNSSAGFYDLTGMMSISVNRRNNLSLFGYSSNDNFSFSGSSNYRYANNLASLRWNSMASDKISWSMTAGLSQYDYEVRDNEEHNPFISYRLKSSIDYRTIKGHIIYYHNTRHNLELGFNAVNYHIRPGEIFPLGETSEIVPDIMDYENALELAVYISDNVHFSDRFSVEAGLRYSHYLNLGNGDLHHDHSRGLTSGWIPHGGGWVDARYGGLEPRINLRYSTGTTSSIKMSYNRIYQYINLISNTAVIAPSDLWKLSDHHLKPLKSDQFAIGYFRNFHNNSIETSIEAYYKDMMNAVEYKEGARIIMNHELEADLINARGYNYGIELFVRKNSGRLTGWFSYSYSASLRRSQEEEKENRINNNNYFPSNYDKPHDLVVNSGYRITRRWVLGGTFTYSTGRPVTLPDHYFYQGSAMLVRWSERNSYRLPDYHRLDISLTRRESLRVNNNRGGNWTFSLLNVYSRKNAYSIFYEKAEPTSIREGGMFNLYKLYIIGRPLPTITYNFRF